MTISRLLAVTLSLIWLPPALSAPQLGKDPIGDIIAAMTIEEKVGMVMGTGMNFPGLPPDRQGPAVGQTSERVPGAAGQTLAIPRLGIPAIVLADGPAGLRISPLRESDPNTFYYCTAFPIATLLASTWDTELVEQVGRAVGNELKEYGVDILLAPALNMHRNPLGGRNFEYYSEDPLVSGKMTAAMVRGVQSQGVGTATKHYVANDHEWNRYTINVKVDERALREIYLKGFEIAVKEGKPWTVMSSYNRINGTYTSESARLLQTILRDQWGFSGLVMTDWFGGRDAIAQMNAGNDLLMPGTGTQQKLLLAAIGDGKLDAAVLDRNIENILKVILQTPAFKNYRYSNQPDLKLNAQTARAAATAGIVLLKNTGRALPLPAQAQLALFGNSSYDLYIGGTGSGDVNEAYAVSLPEGLAVAGFVPDNNLAEMYSAYIKDEKAKQAPPQRFRMPPPVPERLVSDVEIKAIAAVTDLALITIGRNSGEFADRRATDDFNLTAAEQRLINRVSEIYHASGKKVVVILNIGGVIETASWRDHADAILLAWQPGQEAGHAIADVLVGKVNPSGKLATTFALQLADYPSTANFPGVVLEAGDPNDQSLMASARAAEIEYKDGIWVGYRHFNTRQVTTAYPFGFGLSYTDFTYSDLQLSSNSFADMLTASVTITNSGTAAGKEIVQLYLAAPAGTLPKPALELKAFGKTRLLQPGESQTLAFELKTADLASFDPAASEWLADAGTYTINLGASSADIRLSGQFRNPRMITIKP